MNDIELSTEYRAILAAYNGRRARRTMQPYMRHIDQGLILLDKLGASHEVLRAWCVHPIFQLDDMFSDLMSNEEGLSKFVSSTRVAVLAMEYRSVANAFLTKGSTAPSPRKSPIHEVNTMLIADKIQNFRDARNYLFHVLPDNGESLTTYFQSWLDVLGVTRGEQVHLELLLVASERR